MKLERFLYKNSTFWFMGFFVFALVAFWPNYFGRPFSRMDIHFHTHGIAMTLWCLMLIGQAFLIRLGKPKIHRMTGKFSYVLVPLIVLTTLSLLHFQIKRDNLLGDGHFYFMALVINALIVFVLLYGLAIRFRSEPAIHARYMVCTIFPLFTPVTDRLIAFHVKPLIGVVPVVAGGPMLPLIGFAMADLILICLSIWDWRTHKRLNIFPVALIILLIYHISVITFYRFSFWQSFGEWFMSLPLS